MLVTLDHLELILLGQEGVDVGLYVRVGLQDTVPYPLLNWKKSQPVIVRVRDHLRTASFELLDPPSVPGVKLPLTVENISKIAFFNLVFKID